MSMRSLAVLSFLLVSLIGVRAAHAQYGGGDAVTCESRNFAHTRCDVPWRDARLIRQLSDTRCVRGQNWGIDRRGLWVDRGCGGEFAEAGRRHHDDYGGGGGGWHPGPDWDHRFAFVCESQDYRYRYCAVDVGGGGRVFISRQISGTPCIEGRTWGWNRGGLWVDQGCSAEFTVDRRWR